MGKSTLAQEEKEKGALHYIAATDAGVYLT
jgi:hypothetical protein